VKEVANGIYEFKNFISKDASQFLLDSFSKYLDPTPQGCNHSPEQTCIHPDQIGYINSYSPEIKAPRKNNKNLVSGPFYRNDDSEYNIALDFTENIVGNIEYYMNDIYKKEYVFKSLCFQLMVEGASNSLHADTFDEDKLQDRSGILYLNDSYDGGEINFPSQGIKIKPETGTLLVFFGDENIPHEVCKITSGKRYNLVSFYEPRLVNE
jgi:hypothetical protein